MELEIQAQTYILVISKSDPFVLHNPLSHSDAYTWPISTWSRYSAIHLLPNLNTDCPSQSDLQTSDVDLIDMADRLPAGLVEVGLSQEMTENLDCLGRCVSDDVDDLDDVPWMDSDNVHQTNSDEVSQTMCHISGDRCQECSG